MHCTLVLGRNFSALSRCRLFKLNIHEYARDFRASAPIYYRLRNVFIIFFPLIFIFFGSRLPGKRNPLYAHTITRRAYVTVNLSREFIAVRECTWPEISHARVARYHIERREIKIEKIRKVFIVVRISFEGWVIVFSVRTFMKRPEVVFAAKSLVSRILDTQVQ